MRRAKFEFQSHPSLGAWIEIAGKQKWLECGDVAPLVEAVDSPSLSAALDTVAMGVAGETPHQWFERLGEKIVHCHFSDGRPYGHLVWGDGVFPLERYLDVLNEFGYEGMLGQEITDGRYLEDPKAADRRNFHAFERFFAKEEA